MNPPTMAGWNLALRFGLEIAALAGLGFGAWRISDGAARWPLAIVVPLIAAFAWGVFNVPTDPSRSGDAPVVVDGWVRLAVELAVLGAGVAGVALAGMCDGAIAFAALIIFHYAASWSRITWLLDA